MDATTGALSERSHLLTENQEFRSSPRVWGPSSLPVAPRSPEESSGPIQGAQRLEDSPSPVQKEAKKVNWYIFTALLVLTLPLLGVGGWAYLIYKNCSSAESQSPSPQVSRSAASNRDGGSSILPSERKAHSKTETTVTFSTKSSEVYIASHLNDRERNQLSGDKEVAQAEFESYGRLLAESRQELHRIQALIPVVKEMGFIERKLAGHPSSSDLEKQAKGLQEEISGYEKKVRDLQTDLTTFFVQHPRFREKITSHEGFPFQMIFDKEELKQGHSYECMPMLPRNDLFFQKMMGQKLMEWSGEEDIDPVGMNIAAQAQLVMVSLSRKESLFVLDGAEERIAQPKTVPRSLVVRFELENRKPIMRVEREVVTNQGKRYQWTEIVRFDGRGPIATRNVTEIKS